LPLILSPEEAAALGNVPLPISPEDLIRAPAQQKRYVTFEDKTRKLHETHTAHPEYKRKDLNKQTGISYHVIAKYWNKFVEPRTHRIRAWDEVVG
jgi:hypothetical protein